MVFYKTQGREVRFKKKITKRSETEVFGKLSIVTNEYLENYGT